MTVAVSCNLSDGVILGVDSAVTIPGPDGIIKVYENAEKLFQLADKPIGVATYGMAAFGSRNIGSYLREFEARDPNNVITSECDLEQIVEELRKFFYDKYQSEIVPLIEQETGNKISAIPKEQLPTLGLVVGGFSSKAYLSEVWSIVIPLHDTVDSAEQTRSQSQFGSNWFAMFQPISRYTHGYDPALIDELLEYIRQLRGTRLIKSEEDQVRQILSHHEYIIPFEAMPLEEGLRYTRFLVELVINHHRFVIGAPVVGGGIRLGRVSYRGERFELLDSNS